MTPSRMTRVAPLHAVLAAAGVGALAGAGAPWVLPAALPFMFGSPSVSSNDVADGTIAGLIVGFAVAVVCVTVFSRAKELSILLPVGTITGLILAVAFSSWTLRGDSEKNDSVLGAGILGGLVGLIVAATLCVMLAPSVKNMPNTDDR